MKHDRAGGVVVTVGDFFLSLFFMAIIFGIPAIIIVSIIVAFTRSFLWWISPLFFLVDSFMWFLYNPFRYFMRGGEEARVGTKGKLIRFSYLALNYSLVALAYKLWVYLVTFPLRIITALYFDVLVYLAIATADSIEDLIDPKYYKMRKRSGIVYAAYWVIGIPFRLVYFAMKNLLSLIDSILMFFVSVSWPTFTMFHGTDMSFATDISKNGKWLVGTGNYGGSGIYFGRSVKVAKSYSQKAHHVEPRIIVSRVTFTILRNCSTLHPDIKRRISTGIHEDGAHVAKSLKFPFYATEFFRTDTRQWWEYCLIRGGEDGRFIRTWRIRPIGLVRLDESGGKLDRLWGGKKHYCLHLPSVVMGVASFCIFVGILAINVIISSHL